eukprot:TRINITY_DN7427_c0_g1_i2.p2 TRINITY_DN7427_c0_g1~~TRINITY_DN7427_c0_g1_i2.p2  ORF type:complete len:419 (+),score=159.04 TRINITY_DN7427_c0_g1_i2:1056-2312(+)
MHVWAWLLVATLAGRQQMKIVEHKQKPTAAASTPPARGSNCKAGSLLQITFNPEDSTDKIYGNSDVFLGHLISEGDKFEYEMLWEQAGARANIDLEATIVSWRLRDDAAIKDQNGYANHCERTSLDGKANGVFYKRVFDLTPAAGKHINTLLFASNAGQGVKASMLVKSIRIIKAAGGELNLWDGTQTLLNAYSYFPGNIATECKSSYVIKGDGHCRPSRVPAPAAAKQTEDDDDVGVDVAATGPQVGAGAEGETEGGGEEEAEAQVYLGGEEVACDVKLELSQSTTATPPLSVRSARVELKHPTLAGLPLALNESVELQPHILVQGEPYELELTFDLPALCSHSLLLEIYNASLLVVTAQVWEGSDAAAPMDKELLSTSLNLGCTLGSTRSRARRRKAASDTCDADSASDECKGRSI